MLFKSLLNYGFIETMCGGFGLIIMLCVRCNKFQIIIYYYKFCNVVVFLIFKNRMTCLTI